MATIKPMAKRTLLLDGVKSVKVRLWAPTRYTDEHRDYFCDYQITGLGFDEKIYHSLGADSFQALVEALRSIDCMLRTSEAYKSGKLSWVLDGGDLGFGDWMPKMTPAT